MDTNMLKVDSRLGRPNNFLMFWSYFLLKKENYPISAFVQSLFQQKRARKLSICRNVTAWYSLLLNQPVF